MATQSVSSMITPKARDMTNLKNLLRLLSMKHLLVIAAAYACAYPGAVVIKLVDAVIADVAMGGPEGSEDKASFAELQPTDLRSVDLLDCPVEHASALAHDDVLVRHLCVLECPYFSRNDTRVREGGSEQVDINDGVIYKQIGHG